MLYMDFVLRVALSMMLGFLIGLERQLTGHPAGIRINVLICMGTSFFTLFPMLYGSDQVFRVGSSIISGVGFLCSGVIFKDSGSVRGMNTAATLWCTAAIGILASTGMCAMAVTAAALLIGSNLILRPLARKVNPIAAGEENEKQYRISVTCQESAEQELRALLIQSNCCKTLYLTNLESGDVVGDKVEIVAEYCSSGKSKRTVLESIVGQALKLPEVISAGWEVLGWKREVNVAHRKGENDYGLHLHLFWCPLHPWRFCVRHRKWTLPSVCVEKYAPGRKREDCYRSALPQHWRDHCAERYHLPAQGSLGWFFRPLVCGSHGGMDDHSRL